MERLFVKNAVKIVNEYMMTVTKAQLEQLNVFLLESFINKMVISLAENLGIDLSGEKQQLRLCVQEAINRFNISEEENLEMYLLHYYTYTDFFKRKNPSLFKLLLNKDLPEEYKIERIQTFLHSQQVV